MDRKEFRLAAFMQKAAVWVVGVLSALIAGFLSVVSLLHTTAVEVVREGEGMDSVVNRIHERLESVIYYNDNFVLNLLVLAAGILMLFILASRVKKVPLRKLQIALFLWTLLLGTVWVLSSQVSPTEDSWTVTSAAQEFAVNNFDKFENTKYFKNYPFQLGYVLFNECVIRFLSLFKRPETVMVLEVLNAVFLAMINTLLLTIGARLFKDDRVNLMTAVLLAVSAAPFIDCSFTYGIYPGMAFALLAMYLELRWMTDSKIIFGIGAVLSIAFAVMLKSNYLIWLIAMVLILLVRMPARKKYAFDAGLIAAAVALTLSVQPTVKRFYENRSGHIFGDAIPYASWIAMGLSETDLAPGWYNIYITVGNFESSNYAADEAGRRSRELIKERLKYFAQNPQYANDFFYLKTVSQWNEPSYQSIWNNTVRGQYKEKNAFAHWVCYEGEQTVKQYMDYFAQLVFVCFFLGALYLLRKKQFLFTMIPVVFLGGFFYQFISEGKAQYIIPYFIAMTGFAAFGAVSFYDSVMARVKPDSLLARICPRQIPAAEAAAAEDAVADDAPAAENAGQAEAEHTAKTDEAAPAETAASGQKTASGKQKSERKKGAKK